MIDISFHQHNQKFPHDAIRYEDEKYLIQTGGVFTSIQTIKKDALARHIIREYNSKGESFVKDLRGSFMIYLFDKSKDLHLVYTNHLGDKRVFFFNNQNTIIVSSSVQHITSNLKENKRSYSLNRDAAYFLLTYGYLFGDRSIVSEIKRLKPGQYLRISHEKLSVKTYHSLDNSNRIQVSYGDALEQVDMLFRQAVSREFEKDKAYDFSSISSLSGGLDSRMCTWVGHDLGYSDISNFTFAQSGSLDMTIPQEMSKELGHKWLFIPLDKASFMTDIDEVIRISEGSVAYLNLSHGKYAIDQVDFSKFGMMHTGQLGDVTLGSYSRAKESSKPIYSRAVCNSLIHKLPAGELEAYENLELMLFQNRGLNNTLSGNLFAQRHTEVSSPFLDVDFLDYCFSLPLEYRFHHKLYKHWILEKYNGAAAYTWERIGRKISEKTLNIRGKDVPISRLPFFVLDGISFHLNKKGKEHSSKNQGMNPFQHWYNSNDHIRQFFEQYFNEHIDLIMDQELKKDCHVLFSTGTVVEKTHVLSLLASIKLFWS